MLPILPVGPLSSAESKSFYKESIYLRVMNNLNELKNPERLSNYKSLAEISRNVCSKNGPVQGGPLGV